jgi:ABC-type dipeptide/oligopeptide/nickel transport system permease subunit
MATAIDLADGTYQAEKTPLEGVMTLLLFALNFLGDGVRDALDPRMRT